MKISGLQRYSLAIFYAKVRTNVLKVIRYQSQTRQKRTSLKLRKSHQVCSHCSKKRIRKLVGILIHMSSHLRFKNVRFVYSMRLYKILTMKTFEEDWSRYDSKMTYMEALSYDSGSHPVIGRMIMQVFVHNHWQVFYDFEMINA